MSAALSIQSLIPSGDTAAEVAARSHAGSLMPLNRYCFGKAVARQ